MLSERDWIEQTHGLSWMQCLEPLHHYKLTELDISLQALEQ